jgi:hypothetical protein
MPQSGCEVASRSTHNAGYLSEPRECSISGLVVRGIRLCWRREGAVTGGTARPRVSVPLETFYRIRYVQAVPPHPELPSSVVRRPRVAHQYPVCCAHSRAALFTEIHTQDDSRIIENAGGRAYLQNRIDSCRSVWPAKHMTLGWAASVRAHEPPPARRVIAGAQVSVSTAWPSPSWLIRVPARSHVPMPSDASTPPPAEPARPHPTAASTPPPTEPARPQCPPGEYVVSGDDKAALGGCLLSLTPP